MKEFSRRDLLKGLGSMGGLALASPITGLISACSPPATLTNSQTNSGVAIATSDSPDCNLTPEAVEGPYYIKASDLRQDITEGKVGVPMELLISVVNARTCLPIANATVDVWHADAEGLYSAYAGQGDSRNVDTSKEKFLRGVQVTDSQGLVIFKTIYPGWYRGRTAHIHFKIYFQDSTRVTSQFFFPDTTSTAVYTQETAYKARGDQDTPLTKDSVRSQMGTPERVLLNIAKVGGIYKATSTLGIVTA